MFLFLASTFLMTTIIFQNILVPSLRQETVSDGLYGPYHWWLDGAYILLISALLYTFIGTPGVIPVVVASISLFVTMISNTFSTWVDKWTGNRHSLIHTWFTVLLFLAILTLEALMNSGVLWYISLGTFVVPLFVFSTLYLLKLPGVIIGPQVEKAAIFMLCLWLEVWGLI